MSSGPQNFLGPPTVDPTALEAYIQICSFKGSEISVFFFFSYQGLDFSITDLPLIKFM